MKPCRICYRTEADGAKFGTRSYWLKKTSVYKVVRRSRCNDCENKKLNYEYYKEP